jgi:hypothetical protein
MQRETLKTNHDESKTTRRGKPATIAADRSAVMERMREEMGYQRGPSAKDGDSKPSFLAKNHDDAATFVLHSELRDRRNPSSGWATWGELVQDMSGPLAGRKCHVRFDLVDGRVLVGDITYKASEAQPLNVATNRALAHLRQGDIPAIAEACLRNLTTVAGVGMDWLTAFEATRSRAGRGGFSRQTWALVALRRVQAEDAAPGRALAYMCQTWPGDRGATFSTVQSAKAKVNQAVKKGMLEHGPQGLRLTAEAQELLEINDEGTK